MGAKDNLKATALAILLCLLTSASCGLSPVAADAGARAPAGLTPAGPELSVEVVVPQGDTGTMLYADRLVLDLPDTDALVFQTDVEQGQLAPIIGPRYALGEHRYLLIGTSSWGAGMITRHAWLMGSHGGSLAVLDRLELTTDRAAPALRIEPSSGSVCATAPGVVVHAPEDWALQVGAIQYQGTDEMRKLYKTGGSWRDETCFVVQSEKFAARDER